VAKATATPLRHPSNPIGTQAGRRGKVRALTVPVERGSVVALVIERVKEALLRRDLKPGDYLPPEAELSKNLGVGKSTVREAMKMLQAMGVVEVRRGQGTHIRLHPGPDFVSPLIFQLIIESGYPEDLVQLRMMFEPAASVMAMHRATEDDLERIRKTVETLEAAIRAGTQTAEEDLAFHYAILEATGNPLVCRIGETIFQLFTPSIGTSMKSIPDIAVRDHRRIFEAFAARDEAQLRLAVLTSYEGWKTSLHRD
jgi:GntR family transcriptional regulator, transcriptional repressor for pyruvate dehydrogenase complex